MSAPSSASARATDGLCPRRFPRQVPFDDVPRFDGRPSSWSHFARLFEDVVGANPYITNCVKLDPLSRAVPDYQQTILSYHTWEEAMTGLEERFTRGSVLITDLLRMAAEVPFKDRHGRWLGRVSGGYPTKSQERATS